MVSLTHPNQKRRVGFKRSIACRRSRALEASESYDATMSLLEVSVSVRDASDRALRFRGVRAARRTRTLRQGQAAAAVPLDRSAGPAGSRARRACVPVVCQLESRGGSDHTHAPPLAVLIQNSLE